MFESVRLGLKAHSYFREKLLHCMPQYQCYKNFIPEYYKKMGITIDDIQFP